MEKDKSPFCPWNLWLQVYLASPCKCGFQMCAQMLKTPESNPDGVSFFFDNQMVFLSIFYFLPLPVFLYFNFLGFYFLFSRNWLQQCPDNSIFFSIALIFWGLWLELKFQTIKFDKIPWSFKWNWALNFLTCFKGKVSGSFLVPGFPHMVSSVPTAANFILSHRDISLSHERPILMWEKCDIYQLYLIPSPIADTQDN